MVFYLAVLLVLIFYGISFSGTGSFNEAYLDRKNTAAINGIFVILVVFSHYSQYAGFGGIFDAPYLLLKKHLHQMVVATFLFYSGFGMMEQIKRKGSDYVFNIPKKAGKLLFRFDAAVMLFLLMNLAFGKTFKMKRIVLSLIGWKAVGNSNWYIFDILVLYMLMFIAFGINEKLKTGEKLNSSLFRKHTNLPGLILFFVLALCFVYIMMKTDKETRWYNTVILLPIGCFYSEFREEIERLVMKNDVTYYLTLLIVFVSYLITFLHRHSFGIEGYTAWACCFISFVILVTMKVRIYNRILEWFGMHVFSIYILQRLPMIVLDRMGLIDSHKYLCLIAVFALAIPLAIAFEKATDAVLNRKAAVTPQ